MLSPLKPSTGKLLISEPFLNDPNFRRSVVLLTECSELGAMGFVLNQPSNLLLKDLVADLWETDFQVFIGGPVEIDTIHFLHNCFDKLGGEQITENVYWGGDFETLKLLINNNSIQADEVKFFLGYSGWEAEQLKDEIEINTWIVSDQFGKEIVFSNNEEELWREVIINLGPKYAHISNFPRDPSLN